MDKQALWNAIKEPLRLLVLAILPFVVAYFTNIDTQWAFLALLALRGLDKYLHEMGKKSSKKNKESILLKGLTRF